MIATVLTHRRATDTAGALGALIGAAQRAGAGLRRQARAQRGVGRQPLEAGFDGVGIGRGNGEAAAAFRDLRDRAVVGAEAGAAEPQAFGDRQAVALGPRNEDGGVRLAEQRAHRVVGQVAVEADPPFPRGDPLHLRRHGAVDVAHQVEAHVEVGAAGAQAGEGRGGHGGVRAPPDLPLARRAADDELVAGGAAGVGPRVHEEGAAAAQAWGEHAVG